jgi:protein-disulfide isomerase
MNRFRRAVLALACAGAFLTPALAQELTPGQRTEIEALIKDYLMKNPGLIKEALEELDRRQTAEAEAKAKVTISTHADLIFRSPDDLVLGNPKGSVTIVEFFDYNCGYCKKALPEIAKLLADDSDLRLVIKEFPILSPGSLVAAKAVLAARQQGKHAELHEALNQLPAQKDEVSVLQVAQSIGIDLDRLRKDMENEAVTQVLQRTYQLAEDLGINGTPSFLVDDNITPGYVPHEVLARLVAGVRESGGCKVC